MCRAPWLHVRGGEGAVKLDGRLAPPPGIAIIQRVACMATLSWLNHPICFNNWIKARETGAGPCTRLLPICLIKEDRGFLTMLAFVRRATWMTGIQNIRYHMPDKIAGAKDRPNDRLDA